MKNEDYIQIQVNPLGSIINEKQLQVISSSVNLLAVKNETILYRVTRAGISKQHFPGQEKLSVIDTESFQVRFKISQVFCHLTSMSQVKSDIVKRFAVLDFF